MRPRLHASVCNLNAPQESARAIDEMFELQRGIFAGVERQEFEKTVANPAAKRNRALLLRHETRLVGFCALRRFEIVVDSEAMTIFKMEAALERAFRGHMSYHTFIFKEFSRYVLAHPTRRVFYISAFIHPASYWAYVKCTRDIYPTRRREPTPTERREMDAIADALGYRRDPERPAVRDVGWVTIDQPEHDAFWRDHPNPDIQYFLRNNPDYKRGRGLLTLIPVTPSNLLASMVTAMRVAAERAIRGRHASSAGMLPRRNIVERRKPGATLALDREALARLREQTAVQQPENARTAPVAVVGLFLAAGTERGDSRDRRGGAAVMPPIALVTEGISRIRVIDTHTAGAPTRILLDCFGLPPLAGDTLMERWISAHERWDALRRRVLLEPRGHDEMVGAAVVPPARDDCDYGVIFFDCRGFLAMCVHGTIGVARVLLDAERGARDCLRFDTPAGVVEARRCRYGEIEVHNVASFAIATDLTTHVAGRAAPVRFDVAFGGNLAAIVDARQLGLPIARETVAEFRHLGGALRRSINEHHSVAHPTDPRLRGIALVCFVEPATSGTGFTNLVVFGRDQVDRSPCGTGTSAQMALFAYRGLLREDTPCTFRSVAGESFVGVVRSAGCVLLEDGSTVRAYAPVIRGRAYLTGAADLLFEASDPLAGGFSISR